MATNLWNGELTANWECVVEHLFRLTIEGVNIEIILYVVVVIVIVVVVVVFIIVIVAVDCVSLVRVKHDVQLQTWNRSRIQGGLYLSFVG